jgi:Fe2+ transport system protein FeoA
LLLPLDVLSRGQWADVVDVAGEPGHVCRLAELGLRCGSRVCVLQPGSPCLVQVGGCRLSLRGGDALCILVRPVRAEPRH